MRKSRKQLLAEIESLTNDLAQTRSANHALADLLRDAKLNACFGCKNLLIIPIGDGTYKCTCKKKVECDDFTPVAV